MVVGVRLWTVVISLLALVAVLVSVRMETMAAVLSSLNWSALALAVGLLLINLLIAYWRFSASFSVLGVSVPHGVLRGPFFVGQIANLLPFGLIGQAAGRSALLGELGVSSSAVTFLSFLERIIALGSLSLFALAGVAVTFGTLHVDPASAGDGPALVYLVVGLVLTSAFVVFRGRRHFGPAFRGLASTVDGWGILRILLLSLLAHATMLGAFWTVFRAVHPDPVPLTPLLGALSIVMFAASLPISFAGWGVRELSSVQALGVIGIPGPVALTTGLAIGALSTIVVLVCIVGAMVYGRRSVACGPVSPGGSLAEVAFGEGFVYLVGFAACLLLPFQVRIPVEGSALVLNMADVFAMAGLAVLAGQREGARTLRDNAFAGPLLVISLGLLLALVVGLVRHGPTSWALVNRGAGWIVILAYFVLPSIVRRYGPARPLDALADVAATAIALVAACQIAVFVARLFRLGVGDDLVPVSVSGFSFNANAFGLLCTFGLLFWMQVMTATDRRRSGFLRYCVPFLLILATMTATSRSGLLLTVVVAAGGLLVDRRLRGPLTMAFAAAVVARVGLSVVPPLLAEGLQAIGWVDDTLRFGEVPLRNVLPNASSDHERLESIVGGLALFRSSPLFGAGLGGFVAYRHEHGLPQLVIHDVPVWILAEFGIVGSVLVGGAFAVIAWRLVLARGTLAGRLGALALFAFAVGCLVHDFFYQRVFWLYLGFIVARLPHPQGGSVSAASARTGCRDGVTPPGTAASR